MDDYKELVAHLRKAEGIGRWTKAMHAAAEAIERLSAELYEANLAKFELGEMLRRITSELQDFDTLKEELSALKEHLATLKSASAEPVAWFHKANGRVYLTTSPEPDEDPREVGYAPVPNWQPLYLHPAPAAVQEDAKDAARYRHLKHDENFCIDELDCDGRWEPVGNLDTAIDAAIEANHARP